MKDNEKYEGFLVAKKGDVFVYNNKKDRLGIKLGEGAIMPKYSHPGDAGADIYSTEDVSIPPMSRRIISTGLYLEIPSGYEVQIRSRSGLAAKEGVFVLNSPGTIDSGYKNEVKIILQNLGNDTFIVEKGDRIAQMVVAAVDYLDFVEISSLSDSKRGQGGLGSTGLK